MKRITEYRKLFNISKETELAELKLLYRGLMKEWHPDKFVDENLKAEAELKSKTIIEAYHFLVSISPETHASTIDDYKLTTSTAAIDDYLYKGQTSTDEEEGWRYTQGDKNAKRPPELLTRDHVARCITREIKEGRGSPHGGVFLDIAWIKEKIPNTTNSIWDFVS